MLVFLIHFPNLVTRGSFFMWPLVCNSFNILFCISIGKVDMSFIDVNL